MNKSEKTKKDFVGKWMLMGMVFGIAIGAATNKIALGIPIGLAIGAGIGDFKWKQELKKNQGL